LGVSAWFDLCSRGFALDRRRAAGLGAGYPRRQARIGLPPAGLSPTISIREHGGRLDAELGDDPTDLGRPLVRETQTPS
jgi:hypothetical protein